MAFIKVQKFDANWYNVVHSLQSRKLQQDISVAMRLKWPSTSQLLFFFFLCLWVIIKCGCQARDWQNGWHTHTLPPTYTKKDHLSPASSCTHSSSVLAMPVPCLTHFDPWYIVWAPAALPECLRPQVVCQPCPTSHRLSNVPDETRNTPSAQLSHLDHAAGV